ncbi:MAG: hypothetical protein ACREIC_32700, partial [Limisphaerales bacterium]
MPAPQLLLFISPQHISQLPRDTFTQFLQEFQSCLPATAVALLTAELSHPQFCSAWATQFSSPGELGAPLLQALLDIELLALPQNEPHLKRALTQVPPGYEPDPWLPPLHKALRLWLIARNNPAFTYPLRAGALEPPPATAAPVAPV